MLTFLFLNDRTRRDALKIEIEQFTKTKPVCCKESAQQLTIFNFIFIFWFVSQLIRL